MRGPAHLLSSLTSGDDRTTLSDVLASAPAQLMQTPVQRETEASAVLRNALSTYTDQQVEASREDLLRSGYYRSALLARRRMQAKQKEAWWTRVLCAVFVAALLVAALLVGSIFARDDGKMEVDLGVAIGALRNHYRLEFIPVRGGFIVGCQYSTINTPRPEQVKTFSPNQNPQVKSPVGGFTKQQTPRSIYSISRHRRVENGARKRTSTYSPRGTYMDKTCVDAMTTPSSYRLWWKITEQPDRDPEEPPLSDQRAYLYALEEIRSWGFYFQICALSQETRKDNLYISAPSHAHPSSVPRDVVTAALRSALRSTVVVVALAVLETPQV